MWVCVWETDARLSIPIDSLTRTSKWKRKFLHECRSLYECVCVYIPKWYSFLFRTLQLIFFCSFRVFFFSSLCRLPCYFHAIEISGCFFPHTFFSISRLRLILFGINATNENRYKYCMKLYVYCAQRTIHKDAGSGAVGVISHISF